MFTDSEIASNFTLGKAKCSYFINFGIAPFFKESLKKQINLSPFYSLSFDESMHAVTQSCQMDVAIRFSNQTNNMVETCYYDSQFLHRPNASELLGRSLTAASCGLKDEKP